MILYNKIKNKFRVGNNFFSPPVEGAKDDTLLSAWKNKNNKGMMNMQNGAMGMNMNQGSMPNMMMNGQPQMGMQMMGGAPNMQGMQGMLNMQGMPNMMKFTPQQQGMYDSSQQNGFLMNNINGRGFDPMQTQLNNMNQLQRQAGNPSPSNNEQNNNFLNQNSRFMQQKESVSSVVPPTTPSNSLNQNQIPSQPNGNLNNQNV